MDGVGLPSASLQAADPLSLSSGATSPELSRQLIFSNAGLSVTLLIGCFLITLVATLVPFACMRSEQFKHWQIVALSVWHAFIAGVILAAAWTVFLPNMIAVASHMELPSPAIPFILLFLALLLPLLLDKILLWLVGSRKRRTAGGQQEDQVEHGTPSSGAATPVLTATTPLQKLPSFRGAPISGSGGGSLTPSRKASLIAGSGVLPDYDERKGLITPRSAAPPMIPSSSSGRSGGRRYDETAPLTGSDIESGSGSMVGTPHGTPSQERAAMYGSAKMSVDALEFKARQVYIARCAFCKENITNRKGLAFHAAGCQLRSFHAFSFSSRWMQGLRGDRSNQREVVMHEDESQTPQTERTVVGWSIAAYVCVLCLYNVALAGGVNFQEAALLVAEKNGSDGLPQLDANTWLGEILHVTLVGLVMFCFTWFYGFALGMMLRLHRITLRNWRSWVAILVYAYSLPAAIMLNAAISSHLPSKSTASGTHAYSVYLLVCQCACVGVLLYCAFIDMILEEWARREAMPGKTIAFAVGATMVCVCAVYAPML
jgi:hypothetical protein